VLDLISRKLLGIAELSDWLCKAEGSGLRLDPLRPVLRSFLHFPEDLALDETKGLGLSVFFVTPESEGVCVMTQASQFTAGENPVQNMTELITEIAHALVDDPSSVSVEAIAEGDSTVIRLRVAQSDVGKVIGKQGRTARSMRTILSAASMKLKHRFSLDIVEQGEPPASQG
jgi:predicted RNA-binding protein YlqC (UPF0109 family)